MQISEWLIFCGSEMTKLRFTLDGGIIKELRHYVSLADIICCSLCYD